MNEYVILLRGINVGGKNKIKMTDLRTLCEETGASDVRTYIQSGNIVMLSPKKQKQISSDIQKAITETYGYSISVLTIEKEKFLRIESGYPFDAEDESKALILFFESADKNPSFPNTEPDMIEMGPDALYLYHPNGVSGSKISYNQIEKAANIVCATGRNLRTVRKIISLLS